MDFRAHAPCEDDRNVIAVVSSPPSAIELSARVLREDGRDIDAVVSSLPDTIELGARVPREDSLAVVVYVPQVAVKIDAVALSPWCEVACSVRQRPRCCRSGQFRRVGSSQELLWRRRSQRYTSVLIFFHAV